MSRAVGVGIVLAIGVALYLAETPALAQAPGGRAAGRVTRPAVREVTVVERSIDELQQAMASGAVTSRELTAAFLARIDAYDKRGPTLNALIALNPNALAEAEALDVERRQKGPRGALHGIPVVIKDNYETRDLPTTGGTVALAGFLTGRDAFQVRKLREAGVVIVGKTNLHELAFGITTVSSLGGQTRNPYEPTRSPGGSSGGTGAAVAASLAVFGMASDTCGSIRIPAANNNLFGLRGTAGLSSRTGIIPLSHTQDIGGPLARTVTDLALALDATVGADPADAVTQASVGHIPRSYRDALTRGALTGVRVGVLRNLMGTAPEDEEVGTIVRRALELMKAQGAELVEVNVPGLDEALAGSSLINSEFVPDLRAYLAQAGDAPVRSLQEIVDGGFFHTALAAIFKQRAAAAPDEGAARTAHAKRALALAMVEAALVEHRLDAFAYPTLRRRPVVIDEPQRGSNCQLSASTGLPAMAMPAGFTTDGVPIGFEILGPAWSEAKLLAMAYAYEQAASPRRPPPTTPELVGGRPPQPASVPLAWPFPGRATLQYDYVSGRLSFEVPAMSTLAAITLHRGAPGANGPAVARVLDPAAPGAPLEVVLPPYLRTALLEGELNLLVRSASGRHVVAVRPPPLPAAR